MPICMLRRCIVVGYIFNFVIILFDLFEFLSLFLGEEFDFHANSLIK